MATITHTKHWPLAIAFLTIFGSFPAALAQEIVNGHCLYGCPVGADSANDVVIRPIYTVSYNSDTKSADWVAYRVSAATIGIASSLSRNVKNDEFVSETLSSADFLENSDFEFSRLVPLVDFAGTPFWQDVNYSTNFVPRTGNLNQGAWYGLNWASRNAVNRLGEVYVIAGPVFYDMPEKNSSAAYLATTLATSKTHRIPDAFFKIILVKDGGLSAFLFDQNTPVHVHHCDLEVGLEKVQSLTGLNFLPQAESLDLESIKTSLGCF